MSQLVTELTTDFKRGQVDDTAGTRFPQDALALILNGRLLPDATVKRRGGSVRLHTTALNGGALGYGGITFVTAAGVSQMISFVGDSAYKSEDYGVTWTQIATGLREDYYDFAVMRVGATNYLYAANGDTTIKSWDGTNWDTLDNAPSGVTNVEVALGRLWATGHSGVIVQGSKVANPDVWASPDGLTVQLLVASGGLPVGLFQSGPHLLVFSEEQVSYIDGYGVETIVVATGATGISRSVGCVGFRTIVATGDEGCCWLSRRGVEFYTPGKPITLLSRGISGYMGTIDYAELATTPGRPSAVYDQQDEEYLLALSTTGTRNDTVFRFSLRQRSQTFFGAPSVDKLSSPTGDIKLLGDANGYLTSGIGGYQTDSDTDGYMNLAYTGSGGDPIGEDANGYLETVTDDTMPAVLFVAPTASSPGVVHSVGYDGFVRVHATGDKDDVLKDGTSGSDITMSLVSRPFFFGAPRNLKKVRVAHVASINSVAADVHVGVRSYGEVSALQTVTIPAGALTQAKRKRVMVTGRGDAPQLELHTTDDVRISLLGLSATVLKERV
ncbi:MAG: hypothetical protein NUW01_09700 [Gemmatimonadaceae bacterium]|nr:hypothetical protein [Gemmatimonadaceae bacterium]